MQRDVKAAAISMECPGTRQDHTLERIEYWIERLAGKGVEILCFPEACLTGYAIGKEAMAWAQSMESHAILRVADLARRHEVVVLAGMVERDQEHYFLTHTIFHADGRHTVYRKTHLSPPEERIFQAGRDPGLLALGFAQGGVALCYEAHFPEWIARLVREGAEILFFPHASPHETPDEKMARWLRYLPARAYDNSAFVLACNQGGTNEAGLNFPAVSMILDPKGRVLASEIDEREAVAVATLQAAELARVRRHPVAHFFEHRRPELYKNRGHKA
jgi:predicted amidohydrolase